VSCTRKLSYNAPKRGAEIEYSNRNYSKPEIDFAKIPTAFKNVRRGLTTPLLMFCPGALKGVELEIGPAPKNFEPPYLAH